jgi:hypothetical protein
MPQSRYFFRVLFKILGFSVSVSCTLKEGKLLIEQLSSTKKAKKGAARVIFKNILLIPK